MRNTFNHLHLHTRYSLNDAMIKAKDLAKKCKEYGMKAVAVTEHGHMMNMPEAYLALKDEGIKLIVGMEAYVSTTDNKIKKDRGHHLVLLCENNTGYQNLMKIASDAAVNGYYYNPRTDKHKLRLYHEGLIATSACLGSSINRALLADDYDAAKLDALEYQDIFGKGNFFLEIQRHGIEDQDRINPLIIKLSRETGIPLVAANDSHYLEPDDWEAHDVQMAIQAKTTINDTKRKVYTSHEFYFKSQEQMCKLFSDIPEACENTVKIADRCNVEIDFKSSKLPPFKLPDNYKGNNYDLLREETLKGLEAIYGTVSKEALDRMDFELGVVDRMGFVNYFLITWDVFRFCRDGTYEVGDASPDGWEPILVGCGRGCFTPNQKVCLEDGRVKRICDVTPGDVVIGKSGSNRVYEKFEYDVDEVITDIQISGETISCTNDHKILAIKSHKCDNPSYKNTYCNQSCRIYHSCRFQESQKLEWIEASKLDRGDYMCIPKHDDFANSVGTLDLVDYLVYKDDVNTIDYDDEFIYTINKSADSSGLYMERFAPVNEETGFIIGALIGNGWTRINPPRRQYEVGLALNMITQYPEMEKINRCLRNTFGITFSDKVRINTRGTCGQVYSYSKPLAIIIKNMIGDGAINKKIPEQLISSRDSAIGLLKGLFFTDGHIPKSGKEKITYSTTSETLAYQLRSLLSRFGIYGGIIYRKRRASEHWATEIKISISGLDAKNLYNLLGMNAPDDGRYRDLSTMQDEKYIYKRIHAVSSRGYKGKVYDLGVENNPSYNIGGYVVHNSGAGSIMLYGLGITGIDPLKHDLLFQRFLNPDRISMPDIDSDFESTRRQEVIDYVVYKYGRQSICQIITFGTLAARAAIRRVGKALDHPIALYDKLSKLVPKDVGITIKEALAVSQELHDLYVSDRRAAQIIDFAMKLEGLPTNTSTHAAGVLITDEQGVTAHTPLYVNDGAIVSQYDKNLLEDMQLLKMDFLGLKTLGVLGDAKRMVEENHNIKINFDDLYKIEDQKPFQLIRDGKTECLFQISGEGMKGFLKDLQPEGIEDLILGISVYRPGPMDSIPQLLHNKRNPDKIHYPFPELESILKPTYGILCYQESCMLAVVDIAGYSPGDSDAFRKVIAKKIMSKMPLHRKWFIDGRQSKDYDEYGKLRDFKLIPGGVALGIDRSALEKFFDVMQEFGKYSFNKSHAAAYAYMSYVTAWFMYYYPVEFMAANLNFLEGEAKKVKTPRYINYCRSVLNIELLPPRINVGQKKFVALADGRIVYSLMVKGAAENDIDSIIAERGANGEFDTLMDFLIRCRGFLGKKTYEGLIGSGALSDFGIIKSQHLAALDEFWDGPFKKAKDAEKRAIKAGKEFNFEEVLKDRMKDFLLPNILEFPRDVELRLEKSLLGVYLTDNPLYKYAYSIKTLSNFELDSVAYEVDEDTGSIIMSNQDIRNNQSVRFVGVLSGMQELTTKKKTLMARLDIDDLTGTASCLVWPDTYSTIKKNLTVDEIYLFSGYIMFKPDEPPTVVISNAEEMESVVSDRVMITVDSPIEAREVLEQIRADKFIQGSAPTYIIHQENSLLLSKQYWTNPTYAKEKLNHKIQIKVW